MRNLITLNILMFSFGLKFHVTSLVINNYSPYYSNARIHTNGLNGNCYPLVYPSPPAEQAIWQIHPALSPTLPFTFTYDKCYYSDTASIPINIWYRRTGPTNPIISTPNNSTHLLPNGIIAITTDWSFI